MGLTKEIRAGPDPWGLWKEGLLCSPGPASLPSLDPVAPAVRSWTAGYVAGPSPCVRGQDWCVYLLLERLSVALSRASAVLSPVPGHMILIH